MTKARSKILEVLEKENRPMTAADLAQSVCALCDTATVYRSLHFLEEHGMADSFVLYCSAHGTERYYVSHNAVHRHWFHCEVCHRFVDMGSCTIAPMLDEVEKKTGVVIHTHTLYTTGICPQCQKERQTEVKPS
jgi:Fur family ferric uptake transcriptional regulator